jgi:hypothetical protein
MATAIRASITKTPAQIYAFLRKMYCANADFGVTVTRVCVRSCHAPILILPDDIPAHPYAVAMASAPPGAERPSEPLTSERS